MPEHTAQSERPDYTPLGFVANPFPPIDESSSDPLWMRIAVKAAVNRLTSAVMRSSESEHRRPFVVRLSPDIPDYYPRAALNAFLSLSTADPSLSLMSLNIPLEMMRLGRIRGTLAEVSELVSAVQLPETVAAYLIETVRHSDELEAAALSDADTSRHEGDPDAVYEAELHARLRQAVADFAEDPYAAMDRYFGAAAGAQTGATLAEDDAMHEVYIRQTVLEVDPDAETEAAAGEGETNQVALTVGRPSTDEAPIDVADDAPDVVTDADVREELLAHVREDLSPVIARALGTYASWGEGMVAQELKVTKAPRKTLGAILRLMNYRWKRIAILYDRLDAWKLMERETQMEVLAALTELRWIIGEHGAMGVEVVQGEMVEIEEQFAAGEQVDWTLPELERLYGGDFSFDAALVQGWLDSAAIDGTSALKADGPELGPVVEACENDVTRFAVMAEVAFRDAATRGVSTLDAAAIDAALASVNVEDSPDD